MTTEENTDVTAGTDAMLMMRLYRAETEAMYAAKTKARIIGEKFLDILRHSYVPWCFRHEWLEDLNQAVCMNKRDATVKSRREGLLNHMFGNDGFWKKHKVEITKLCFHGYDHHGCGIHVKAHGEEYVLYVPVYEHTEIDRETIENGLLSEYDYQYKCHRKEKAKSSEHFSAYEFVDGKSAYASFDYKVPCNAIRAAIEASAKNRRGHGVR